MSKKAKLVTSKSPVKCKIKKDDEVKVLTGKFKGKTGKVLKVFPKEQKVIVEGITAKKHVRPNPNVGEEGGIKDIEKPIHISNVQFVDPTTQKPTRIGYKLTEQGEGEKPNKARFSKKSGEILDAG